MEDAETAERVEGCGDGYRESPQGGGRGGVGDTQRLESRGGGCRDKQRGWRAMVVDLRKIERLEGCVGCRD